MFVQTAAFDLQECMHVRRPV